MFTQPYQPTKYNTENVFQDLSLNYFTATKKTF